MKRRSFLAVLFALPAAHAISARPLPHTILIRRSPVAGFQYHDGETVWERLLVGQPLQLRREPDNPRDTRAARVEWNGCKLGYLPRVENTAVSQMMDRGERLAARIVDLRESHDPWARVTVEVVLHV